jgi:hypothetical protein
VSSSPPPFSPSPQLDARLWRRHQTMTPQQQHKDKGPCACSDDKDKAGNRCGTRKSILDEEMEARITRLLRQCQRKARQVRGGLSVFKVRGGSLAARQICCRSRRSGAGRAACRAGCRPSGRFGAPTAGVRACPGIRRIRTSAGSARARHCALQLRLPLGVFAVCCSRNASGTGAAAR